MSKISRWIVLLYATLKCSDVIVAECKGKSNDNRKKKRCFWSL